MPDLGDKVFLSPAMVEVIMQIRAAHARAFDLAEKLNELAYREMCGTGMSSNNAQHLLIACLLHRALTTFQGVVILCERGLVSEATALLRTLLEVMFRLVAIAKDAEVGLAYISEDELYRKKFIHKLNLLSKPVKLSIGNPTFDILLATIQQNIDDNGIDKLSTEWFAKRANLEDFYHSAYSALSNTVHVNVRDLESALEINKDGDLTGVNYGPCDDGLDNLLLTAIESLIFCLQGAFSVLPVTSKVVLNSIHAEFTTLHDQMFP